MWKDNISLRQLKIIVRNEFLTDIRNKTFWISTLLVPIVLVVIGGLFGYLMSESDTFTKTVNELPTQPSEDDITPAKAAGMLLGMFLTFFLMGYGAMIFNKVKSEKCNRIMEIISTCVDGKIMMLAKIISVGLTGLLQMFIWFAMIVLAISGFVLIFQSNIPWDYLTNSKTYLALLWMFLYFVGGYIFFGSLYAACGAITDKDNENQTYMTILTFMLLGAFYIGEFAVDNGTSGLAVACSYIPFTSPTVGTINAVSGAAPLWQTLLSLGILYICALFCLSIAGKLYRSSMLLKGKQFSPKDLITFIRS